MIYKNVELYNVCELVPHEGSTKSIFCRIPNELRPKLFPLASKQALSNAGCEIRFNLVGESAKILIKAMNEEDSKQIYTAQIYYGCFQGNTIMIGCEAVEINVQYPDELKVLQKVSTGLAFDSNLVRIILPYNAKISLIDVIGDVSPPEISQTPKKKWLAYGSSITHGSSANFPTGTYAMRTARRLGVDLINLGFAGSAMLDKSMADYIAGREDWDFATLEMGANLIWDSETSDYRPVEDFEQRVDYFVSTIAKAHADKRIFCTDLYTCSSDYKGEAMVNEYRRVVREKVFAMNMPNLHYICGRNLISSVTGLSTDMVHPSDEGMEELSLNLYMNLGRLI